MSVDMKSMRMKKRVQKYPLTFYPIDMFILIINSCCNVSECVRIWFLSLWWKTISINVEIQSIVGDGQLKLNTTQGMQRIRPEKKRHVQFNKWLLIGARCALRCKQQQQQQKTPLSLHILNVLQLDHFNRWKPLEKVLHLCHINTLNVECVRIYFRTQSLHVI